MKSEDTLTQEFSELEQRLERGAKVIEATPSDNPDIGKLNEQYEHLKKRKFKIEVCLKLLQGDVLTFPTVNDDLLLIAKSSKLGILLAEAEDYGLRVKSVEVIAKPPEH